MKITKTQQNRIDAACRRFQRRMQSTISKDPNITQVTMQVGDGTEVVIAQQQKPCGPNRP